MTLASVWVRGITQDHANREKDDFYPTPPEATRALLRVETFEGTIWEPACGDGAISKVLHDSGYRVEASDLVDRGYGEAGVDFLMTYHTVENIVTNPPFKLAEQFAIHALERTSHKVALLCRVSWLEGRKRKELFERTPLARVWVFSNRLSMARGGSEWVGSSGGMIAFAWFVWDHSHKGPPTLGWVLAE